MAALVGVDGARVIRERHARQLPTLGICVGMQVLFTLGEEHGERSEGLGIWPGTVERLDAPRLPHMGWNQVVAPKGSVLFRGIAEERFYFVHSYAARDWTGSDSAVVTREEHGHSFLAAVEAGALSATQFHPEKSGDAGATLIDNWVETL
jgi:glutamine amidotransferase